MPMDVGNLDFQIQKIQEEIRKTPYHKATEHHLGRLKARLSQLKEKRLKTLVKKSGGRTGFGIKKTGNASVILVGPPSVGKSTLLNKITAAASKVGAYDFTTTSVIPGMLKYQGANIQIFDLPGLIEGASLGRGHGKEVLSIIRAADLVLLLVDQPTLGDIDKVKKELGEAGIRLDQKPPVVMIKKKTKGGLRILSTSRLSLAEETIKKVAREFRLENAEITIGEDLTLDRLVDALAGNRVYIPYLLVINKIDQLALKQLEDIKSQVADTSKIVFISAQKEIALEELKQKIWQSLNLIRVYLKKKGQEVDFQSPFILRKNQNLKELLKLISICEKETFKAAKIYGPGARYFGQEVGLDFKPQDEEIIQFILRYP